MEGKGRGLITEHSAGIRLDGRKVSLRSEIWNWDLSDMKQEFQLFNRHVQETSDSFIGISWASD